LIQLFLKYNPVKLFLILLILVAIRVFAYRMSIPITDPELTWLMVGERMGDGFTLYKQVWTDLEPFSAITYYLIDLIFGKSRLAYFVLSLLLVAIQAWTFNWGMNKNKVFKEFTALPALFYVLFSSLFFDFYSLSPVLLGLTFLLITFNMICVQSRVMTGEDRFFYIGLLSGIASLFYLPFAFFLIFSLVSLGLYSVASLKKQMIMVLAFSFPYCIILIYYFWIDNLGNYYEYALSPVLNSAPEFLIDLPTIIKILVLPLLLLLIAAATIVTRGRYIHYQYKIIKIAGLWLLTGVLSLLIEKSIAPHQFLIFVLPLAFFTSHLFLVAASSKLFSEGLFLVMFGGIFLISFYALKKPDVYTRTHLIRYVPHEAEKLDIKNKKIIVLGNSKEYYINNSISAPYVNWRASQWQFADLKKYENISAIYEIFELGKPDYVIDQDQKMAALSQIIPALKKQYVPIDSTNIYRRKI